MVSILEKNYKKVFRVQLLIFNWHNNIDGVCRTSQVLNFSIGGFGKKKIN